MIHLRLIELTCIKKGELIMKYNYFDVPTQVKFWDVAGDHYIGGIAYRNEIICGCCGGVFDINKIYEFAPDAIKEDPIVVYDTWVNLSSKIRN